VVDGDHAGGGEVAPEVEVDRCVVDAKGAGPVGGEEAGALAFDDGFGGVGGRGGGPRGGVRGAGRGGEGEQGGGGGGRQGGGGRDCATRAAHSARAPLGPRGGVPSPARASQSVSGEQTVTVTLPKRSSSPLARAVGTWRRRATPFSREPLVLPASAT